MAEDSQNLNVSAGDESADASAGEALAPPTLPTSAPPPKPRRQATLVGQQVAGRYKVLELIGTGGMGSVYRGEHELMRKQVAIKVLHPEMTVLSEVVARFEREAVAAGRIEHVNVAKATDFGQLQDGSFYLVLEYVEGKNLADVVEEGPMEINRALIIASQMADALAAAHRAGIVHRDLKPDNVMLVEREDEPELVKVLDFGIAKVTSADTGRTPLTRLGTVFGTPEYMAPEQAAGQRVDHRADLYTLGLVLHRMISGTVPFTGDEVSAVLMKQITQPPPPLPAHAPLVVRQLVADLLTKEPDKRIQSGDAVVERISKILEGDEEYAADAERRALRPPEESTPDSGRESSSGEDRVSAGTPVEVSGRHASGRRSVMVALVMVIALLVGGVMVSRQAPAPQRAAASAPKPVAKKIAEPQPSAPEPEPDPELAKLIAGAYAGRQSALEQLQERPEYLRTADEWLALGGGLATQRKYSEALDAYQAAIDKDATVARDPKVLRHLWAAAIDESNEEGANKALDMAVKHFGSRGTDLLYAAWVDIKNETPTTRRAKELVYRADVRKKASPALAVALDLRAAETCEEALAVLPRVARNGDKRSVRMLKRIKFTDKCEIDDDVYNAAMTAISGRRPPRF